MFWFEALQERLAQFESRAVVDYLRSEDARKEDSLGRTLVESAINYIGCLGTDEAALVLFSAITLGRATLSKYLSKALDMFDARERRSVSLKLSELLQRWSSFDPTYAGWLSENLHRLNDQSVKLIDELGADSSNHVRWSIVVDFTDEKLRSRYDMYMSLFKKLPTSRSSLLLQAVKLTNDQHIILQMGQLKEVIGFAMKNDFKKDKKSTLAGVTLDKWVQTTQEQKEQAEFADSNHFAQAYQKLLDMNVGLAWLEESITPASDSAAKVFDEIELPLNHNQRAIAAMAHLNEAKCQRQIWIVPAGKGKSRIHAALTYMFLQHQQCNIKVVFENEGLKKRDEELNAQLKIFENAGSSKAFSKRVSY